MTNFRADEVDMKMRTGLLVLIGASVLLGCRRPDPTVSLLEVELRFMEDQLYLMEAEHQKIAAALASCRRENEALRKDLAADAAPGAAGGLPPRPVPERDEAIPDLAPPTVEEGEEFEPPSQYPQPAELPLDITIRPASRIEPADAPADARVTHIVFNSRLTGGIDLDGQPGDEGLLLVVEPRNADGQYVPSPGELAIVVLDQSKSGPEARVARWDLDSTETSRLIRKTLFGRGIHVEMPWPNKPPESERLQVHVRYTTDDGRQLEADRQVQVDPQGRPPAGWTPAAKPFPAQQAVAQQAAPLQSTGREPLASQPTTRSGGRDADESLPIAPEPDVTGAGPAASLGAPPSPQPAGSSASSPANSATPNATARRPKWSPYR